MKKSFKLALCTFFAIVWNSCNDEERINDSTSTIERGIITEIQSLEPQDQVKYIISEALNHIIINDQKLFQEILPKLIKNNQVLEYLYIQSKDTKLSNNLTLEETLVDQFNGNSEIQEIILGATTTIPNLVIKIPDWTNSLFNKVDYSIATYEAVPSLIAHVETDLTSSKSVTPIGIVNNLPVQVKESEQLIPLKSGTTQTLWGDDLVNDHFVVLKTCPINRDDYIVYTGGGYDFLNKIALNDDLIDGKYCGISMDDDDDSKDCIVEYGRDCVTEKNVIEGFKLANNSVFTRINNQPGGEDVISLHYVFVASQMCGDLTTPMDCPPTSWKFVFFGTVNDFYEIQTHLGTPRNDEMSDVIYTGSIAGNNYYVKSFPRYYDIPVDHSFENIYSQAPYLINTGNSTWDGNIYGSVVSFSVYEHDDVIVKESRTQSVTVTNTTKISAKLKIGEQFESGGDFSNTITRTSSYTYTIETEKDVELGQNAAVYFDQNYQSSDFYGINKSTGSIITHFAYYH